MTDIGASDEPAYTPPTWRPMDWPVPPTPTVRVAGSDPVAVRLVVAAVALLTIAVVKPWPSGASLERGSLAGVTGPAVPPVAARPLGEHAVRAQVDGGATGHAVPTLPPGAVPCLARDWQVVTLERLADRTVRAWWPGRVGLATGPLDPAIPTVRVAAERLLGLGVCAPADDPDAAGPARILAAWSLPAEGSPAPGGDVPGVSRAPVPLVLVPLGASAPAATPSGAASLYRVGGAGWPGGRAVLEIDSPAGADRQRLWIAVDVVTTGAGG